MHTIDDADLHNTLGRYIIRSKHFDACLRIVCISVDEAIDLSGACTGNGAMTQSAPSSGGVWAIQTAEYGLFFTKLIGLLLTGITLGFGLPWAKCMVIKKWTKKVRIDGRSIRFTGTPMGLFGIWVKVCVLSIITLTLYYWFAGYKQVAKYIDNHITWA